MIDKFEVRYTDAARNDWLQLFDFLLERAQTALDFDMAQLAVDTIKAAVETQLAGAPFIYRKARTNPFLRELIIPFRSSGYVALYEVVADCFVNVLAIRHQVEDDYH